MKNKTIIFYDFEATSISRDADPISVGLVAVTEKDVEVEDFKPTHNLIPHIGKHLERHIEFKIFYAEFTDFNIDKCDDWVKENVVGKLKYKTNETGNSWFMEDSRYNYYFGYGKNQEISFQLKQWVSEFEEVEFWADYDVIDKPMLIDLIADWNYNEQQFDTMLTVNPPIYKPAFKYKVGLPKHLSNIRYDQFFDLHTLFKLKGIDTDINREEFAFGVRTIDDNGEKIINYKNRVEEFERLGLTPSKHSALWDAYVSWKCYEKLMNI